MSKRSFATLEKMKAIRRRQSDIDRSLHERIADDYVGLLKSGKSEPPWIIAPQHQEGQRDHGESPSANACGDRGDGNQRSGSASVPRLTNLKLTEAERRPDPRHYEAGQVSSIPFRTRRGFKRRRAARRWSTRDGETRSPFRMPPERQGRFRWRVRHAFSSMARDVRSRSPTGDKVRITNNGFAKTGQRLDNGMLHTVARVRADPARSNSRRTKPCSQRGFGPFYARLLREFVAMSANQRRSIGTCSRNPQ